MSTSIVIWRDIIEIANKVCKKFDLTYAKIGPETRLRTRNYGDTSPCDRCWNSDSINEDHCTEKEIRLRIHQIHRPKRPLSSKTILRTLAHELAHLDTKNGCWNHGQKHTAKTYEIIDYIKSLKYDI